MDGSASCKTRLRKTLRGLSSAVFDTVKNVAAYLFDLLLVMPSLLLETLQDE